MFLVVFVWWIIIECIVSIKSHYYCLLMFRMDRNDDVLVQGNGYSIVVNTPVLTTKTKEFTQKNCLIVQNFCFVIFGYYTT